MELGDLSALAEGELQVFEDVGEHGMVVCRVEGELHAFANLCSHARSPLHLGRLRGAVISCPLHGARFDVRNGTHLCPPATVGIRMYDLLVNADETEVSVLMPRSSD